MDKGVFLGKKPTFYQWELALGIVLAVVLVGGGLTLQSQAALAEQVVRLHVLANSDSEADQALKLLVRDAVLDQATTLLQGVESQDQATAILQAETDAIAQTAQGVVEAQGYDYAVTVTLTQEDYPTKHYEGFSLPAGVYTSLQVGIGTAQGQNWWCVAFPPLCTAATAELSVTAMANGLDGEQVALITQEDGYELRFKAMELWGMLQGALE